MKGYFRTAAALLTAGLLLAGCTRSVRPEDLAGKAYCYEKDGFGSSFTIQLKEDGTFVYYEGSLSSYIGTGKWSLEEDIVTLQEKTKHFCFRVEEEGNSLIFQEEPSGSFLYLTVADGETFSVIDN